MKKMNGAEVLRSIFFLAIILALFTACTNFMAGEPGEKTIIGDTATHIKPDTAKIVYL